MEKGFEESAETAQESQEEVTQPIQSAEIFSDSSEDGPEKQTDAEKIDPSELSKMLGLPSWVKVWVSEDKEEEEWTVTYSIPNKPELIEDIEGIRQVIKINKHLSSLCRFKYEVHESDLIIKVVQDNQFFQFAPIKSKLKVGKCIKELIKTVYGVAKDYVYGNSSQLFSEGAVTIRKKLIKVNLIHGYLQNHGKTLTPNISEHLYYLLQSFVNNNVHFKSQIDKNVVLKETFQHFLEFLKSSNFVLKKIYKEHPLFLDNSQKIRLINIVNDYNQHVFSKKFEQNLSEQEFIMVKNIFVDQTEYWAFRQRIDGSDDENMSKYNWILNMKPEFKRLVIEFNIFMKKNTPGTVSLREDRFTFQLRFARNLIYHCNDYKEKCKKIFSSNDPNDILSEIEKIFPRFITFLFDYHKIQKDYFQAVSEGKIPSSFKFTQRNQKNEDTTKILLKEKAVFNAFYNRVIIPESRKDSAANKKLTQLFFKIKFYEREEQAEDWTALIPIQEKLRNDINAAVQQHQSGTKATIKPYLFLQELLSRLQKHPESKDLEKQALAVYMEKGHPSSIYSCLNLIGESQSEIENAQKDNIVVNQPEADYRYETTNSRVRYPQPKREYPIQLPQNKPSTMPSLPLPRMPLPLPRMPLPLPRMSPPQIKYKVPTCKNYMKGRCTFDDVCKFSHPQTCKADLKGSCPAGANCQSFHIPNLCPSKTWKKCPQKRGCGKVHLPICQNLALCGFCEYGKKCNNYHPPVTICDDWNMENCINPTCKLYHITPMEKGNLF